MKQMSMFARQVQTEASIKWTPPSSLPELSMYKKLWMDSETTGLDPYRSKPVGYSLATEDGKKWYIPFGHAGGGNLDENFVKRWFQREIRNKDLTFTNAKFDNHITWNWGVDLEALGNRLHDVAFQAALLDERRRKFNLDELLWDILNQKKSTLVKKDEKEHISEMPAGVVGPYAEQDAVDVYNLDMALRFGTNSRLSNSIKSDELEKVLDLEDSIIYAVCEMERNGARIDRPKLERWCHAAQIKYERIMMDIYRKVGFRVNPDSATDMGRLFRYLGLEPPRTAKGAESFEGAYLNKIPNETVHLCLEARKTASLISKYLKKYLKALDSNNILRYSLHQLRAETGEGGAKGTISGRFSCAAPQDVAGGGANIQQVMKVDRQIESGFNTEFIIRELFIPDEGHVWCSSDAEQIEFRLFAHYSNSAKLIAAYAANPKVDFHNIVMNLIRQRVANFSRTNTKTINFAKIYGGGRQAIADQMGVDRSVSDPFVDMYEMEFPEAGRLLRQATNVAEHRGFVKTFLGRRARFIKPSSRDPQIRMMEEIAYKPHSALNRVLQGTAADIMKIKIKEVYDNRKLLTMKMRMTVHDEVDGDLGNPERSKQLEEILNTQSIELKVPILWSTDLGENWRLGKGLAA